MTSLLAALFFFAGTASAQQVLPVPLVQPVPLGVAAGVAASLRVAPVTSALTTLPTALTLKLSPQANFLPTPQARPALDAHVPVIPAASAKPLRLVIAGPPGAGKTTYGKRLAQDYGVVHISVGELLRAAAQEHPELAEVMAKGELVDTEVVLDVVQQRLEQNDVRERGFLLDGFPRRMEEARALEAWLSGQGQALDAMIFLDVPDEELRRRILARGRADDTEEVFRGRMEIYHSETEPVIEHLRGRTAVIAPELSGSDIDANYSSLQYLVESTLQRLRR